MNKLISLFMFALVITSTSCTNSNQQGKTNLSNSEDNLIFPKGSKIENDNFYGTAWLYWLAKSDSTNHIGAGSVTFEPGARTSWHLHPDGQIIMVISGVGYYQEKGSPKKVLYKGDVVTCPPDIPHWHGASADKAFVQIAVTSRLKGPTQWLEAVTEEEYLAKMQ